MGQNPWASAGTILKPLKAKVCVSKQLSPKGVEASTSRSQRVRAQGLNLVACSFSKEPQCSYRRVVGHSADECCGDDVNFQSAVVIGKRPDLFRVTLFAL